jgi:serine protease Do
MRTNLGIGTVVLAAASLLAPAAGAQSPATRSRTITAVTTNASYLGIGVRDIDADRARALNLKEVRGTEVTSVTEESPAAKAGFKEGDVVLEYNGQPVEGGEQLTRMVRETPVGRQVKIGVWRGGAMQSLTSTVEARKGMGFDNGAWVMPEVRIPEIAIPPIPQMDMPRFQMLYQSPMLGIEGEALGQQDQFAEFLGVKDGVLVKSVRKDSAAEKAGIKAGDVITKVDESRVSTTRDITSALRAARSRKTVTVTVVRNRKEMTLPVTIEATASGGAVRAGVYVGPRVRIVTPPMSLRLQTRPFVLQLSTHDGVI